MNARLQRLVDRAADAVSARLAQRALDRVSHNPIARAPLGPASRYLELWQAARHEGNAAVDAYERDAGFAIEHEWFHQLALVTQVSIKASAVCYYHGRLLYSTLRGAIAAHPGESMTIVETGTARGFATMCMARAIADAGTPGRILTFDVLPHDVRMYWNCVRDADGPLTRAELLDDYADLIDRYVVFCRGNTAVALRAVSLPRIHCAFLDSVHTYEHVMAEFEALRGRQRPGDILFFDDYTPGAYPGVVAAADEICQREGYAPTVISGGSNRAYLIGRKQ